MKIAAYSSFSADVRLHGADYAARHAALLGFDGVEVIHSKGPLPSIEEAKRLSGVLSSHGLSVVCYSVYAKLVPPYRETTEAELLRHAELAAVLGSPYLHHTLATATRREGGAPTYDEILGGVLDSSKRIAARCEMLGISALYEPQGIYFNGEYGLPRFLALMKEAFGNVGICYDFGNPLFVNADPVRLLALLRDDVRHVHAKNYRVSREAPTVIDKSTSLTDHGVYLTDAPIFDGAIDLAEAISLIPSSVSAISVERSGSDDELRDTVCRLRARLP